jgi:predicted dehydrogenase
MSDSQIVHWGIVGPGRIASQVIKDFRYVDGADALAVASRSTERAEAFAAEHGLARAYGSYAEIMADEDIDAVYIATPHPQHHAIALAAIAAGRLPGGKDVHSNGARLPRRSLRLLGNARSL